MTEDNTLAHESHKHDETRSVPAQEVQQEEKKHDASGDGGKLTNTAEPRSDSPQLSAGEATSANEPPAVEASEQDSAQSPSSKRTSKIAPHVATVPAVSEWSHQQLAPHQVEEDKKEEEDEWQTMPAYAQYDLYDDDGKLIARQANESDEEEATYGGLGGAGKGYTRVQIDDDAKSQTSMDENTAYLFKEPVNTLEDDDEEARDPLAQMQATKDLLTDNQRIAYIGVVRLAMAEMVKEFGEFERTRGVKKQLDLTIEAMKMWTQKMMVRLYSHMELDPAEQIMIEQLAEHGLQPGDLSPALMQNARVKNPAFDGKAEDDGDESTIEVDDKSAAKANDYEDLEEDKASTSLEKMKIDHEATGDHRRDSEDQRRDSEDEPLPPYVENADLDTQNVRSPSQLPKTHDIDIDLRWTVLCDLFLILICDSLYDSRSRVLLERVASFLAVSKLDICRFEKRVTEALEMQEGKSRETWNEDEHMANRQKMARRRRLMMMGLATVGGGLVIGLSAGVLGPVIGAGLAAGFTTIGISGTSGFLAGAGGAALVGTGGVVAGSTMGLKAGHRRTGFVKTFEYRPLHNNKRVNLIVTVGGWLNGKVDDVRLPFSTVDPIMGDIYSIWWEPEMLLAMGQTISILATEALTQGLQQLLGSTILISLMAALQAPILLAKLSYLVDNPWSVSLARADRAGLILADSLIDRNLGSRPITLVGFSVGSRLIFAALQELAKKGALGLVQNVYLFGSPVVAKKDEYLRARTVVAGRFVNGYATNDWILGYLFRATSGGIARVAGLAKVEVTGIENFDVTKFVPGHMAYRTAMPRCLREVGWEVTNDTFTEIEDPDPDNHEKRQRELINEIEEARKELATKQEKRGFSFFRRKKIAEKKQWEIYDERSKAPMDETKDGDDKDRESSDDAMFDIDAIRKEAIDLAAQGLAIKQLETTLPPLKLDDSPKLGGSSTSLSGSPEPRPSMVRGTQSDMSLPMHARSSSDARRSKTSDLSKRQFASSQEEISMSFEPSPRLHPQSPLRNGSADLESPTMTFEPSPKRSSESPLRQESFGAGSPTALNESYFKPRPAFTLRTDNIPVARKSADLRPPEDGPVTNGNKSKETLPSANSGGPPIPPGNPWMDDDDEFEEKEVSMTFA